MSIAHPAIAAARPPADGGARDPRPILPLWHQLVATYSDRRPLVEVADVPGSFPDTLVGDVRRAAVRLSWALEHPRFDHARLGAARTAWRAAGDCIQRASRGLGWHHRYPENARFWLGDALDLALALGAVDARRRAIACVDGAPLPPCSYLDPRALWDDLRHWYMLRRPTERDPRSALLFPVCTRGDHAHVARLLDASDGASLVGAVEDGEPTAPVADGAAFWCPSIHTAAEDA